MTKPLNLYATKVFSEQPIALWALDDPCDYIPLISEQDQDLARWSISGATAGGIFGEVPPTQPFKDLKLNRVLETLGNSGTITMTSPVYLGENDLNTSLGSFAIGAYFITYSRSASVKIGYQTSTLEVIREVLLPATREWAFVSETFSLPEDVTDLKFIIEISFNSTSIPYEIAINGINIGQWAEEFHLESGGVTPEPLPSNINIDSDAVQALPYGLDGASGYYLSKDKILYAKNSGLPLVYGAFNSTAIYPNNSSPSLIVPGFGAMNNSGKYKTFTVEFWAKIQSNALSPKRIFGPISSTDGLYVEGSLLKLKLGSFVQSHYVGSWDRPMLINIRIKPESASLVLNGEEVMNFSLNPELLDYPEKFDINNKDQDWLGFYAHDDVPMIQLDCVGIYPYEVPAIVSKRRWVYGQGVEVPNNIRGLSSANSVFIDGSFSKKAKTYSYPTLGSWSNGVVENLTPQTQSLSLPEYALPDVKFNNQSQERWYFDTANAQISSQDNFIKLKPSADWQNTEGHIFFDNLNFLQDDTKAFYGVFEIEEHSPDKQVLFELVNNLQGAKLTIALEKKITVVEEETYEDYVVNYTLSYKNANGENIQNVIYYSIDHKENHRFLVGLHLDRFTSYFGQVVRSFFGAKQNLGLYVGGTAEYTNTFKGKIYRVGFSTQRNLQKIGGLFNFWGLPKDYENPFDFYSVLPEYDGGTPETDFWLDVLDGTDYPWIFSEPSPEEHLASYTLLPKDELGTFALDIGVDSYWEDYVPISYFAKDVVSNSNNRSRLVSFLQFNIDYPKIYNFISEKYNTSDSMIKTYLAFQYLAEGAISSQSKFSNTVLLDKTGVVRPGSEWINSRYEVLNDTVFYLPEGVNFNDISVTVQVEFQVNGILSNPIKIKSLQISSQSLGQSPNIIGTKFGAEIYPYKKDGLYFDYQSVNPFTVSNSSTPYLYLSNSSGIRMRGSFSPSDNDGISCPINKNLKQFFKVGAFQVAMRYDEDTFPKSPVQIFEIEDKGDLVKFYLVGETSNNKRGYIFAINQSTGSLNNSVIYNLDGRAVKRPTVSPQSWFMLGLSFTTPLDFSSFVGAFRVTSPVLFDSLSMYQITEEDEAERFAYRKWYAVRSEPDQTLDWDYWDESLWSEVLFLSESSPTILDASKIYRQYVGTDRLVFQSDYTLGVGNYRYSNLKDVRWSRQILDSA